MATTETEQHVGNWPNTAGFQTDSEYRTPVQLRISGRFPAATAGTLLRTGPSSYKVGSFETSHWFDGFSQVYRFQLIPEADGKSCRVLLNSRRQVDELLEHLRATGRVDGITFAQKRDPCEGFFAKLKTVFFSSEPPKTPQGTNVSVTIHKPVHESAGRVWECRTDATRSKTIDMETLEPLGVSDQSKLHPELSGPLSGAHAEFDPVNGDCFNYNLQLGRHATYKVFRTSASTGETDILATISGPDVPAAYVHSLFLTENYVVLCVWVAHFTAGGASILWEKNLLDAIAPFDHKSKTHWFVVDRKTGKGVVKKFTSPAMFCFHSINAYEEKQADGTSDIVADLVEFRSLELLHKLYYENMLSNSTGAHKFAADTARSQDARPTIARYRLTDVARPGDIESNAIEPTFVIPSSKAGELPTTNPAYNTKPHRYVYGVTDRGFSSFFDGLVKTDLKSQDALHWNQTNHTPGEPIFVADPERADKEDGGWLLSCVLNGDTGTSYLLCLDAETMKEVGKAESDTVIGFGFHGSHVSSRL